MTRVGSEAMMRNRVTYSARSLEYRTPRRRRTRRPLGVHSCDKTTGERIIGRAVAWYGSADWRTYECFSLKTKFGFLEQLRFSVERTVTFFAWHQYNSRIDIAAGPCVALQAKLPYANPSSGLNSYCVCEKRVTLRTCTCIFLVVLHIEYLTWRE